MPTEKRARQKAARNAKKEAQRKAEKRRSLIKRSAIIGGIAIVVVGSVYLITRGSSSKTTTSTTTTTKAGSTTSTTAASTTSTTASATGSAAALQSQANAKAVAAGCPASTSTRVNTLTWTSAPPMTIDASTTYTATVATTAGTFVITLDAKNTPISVNNFVFLAQKGFYHCVIFHRVIPGFVDQTGDPTGTGTGGPGYTITDELPKTASPQYPLGSVAMANTGSANTGGSQWFIVAGSSGETLSPTYSLFGQVTAGMDVVNTINSEGNSANSGVPPKVTQRILSVTISES